VPWKILVPLALPVIIVSSFVLLYMRKPHAKQGTIVLADFSNTTTDPAFTSWLKAALAADLAQPGFPRILSAAEVSRTLGLSAQLEAQPLNEFAARDVCRRTGSKAVVAGSIAESGGEFVVDLTATGCSSSNVVAEARARTKEKDRVPDALQGAASQLRAKLVELR
jgi:hypothetical protein